MRILQSTKFPLLLVLISSLIVPGCEKDDMDPFDNTIPLEIPTAYGIRVQIDSIVCEYVNGDNDQVEIYGFIKAWSTFDYANYELKEHFEKTDKSLMWFRDVPHWERLRKNDRIAINNFSDFFFDVDHIDKAWIKIQFNILEFDSDVNDAWKEADKDRFQFKELIDENGNKTYEEIDPVIAYNVEDIELYDRIFKNSYTLTLNNSSDVDPQRITVHYSFHPVTVRPEAKLPEGYKAGEEILLPELYPDIPVITGYATPPPARSEQIVVGQKMLSKFSPEPMALRQSSGFNYDVYGINPKFVSGSQLISPEFSPVDQPVGTEGEPWSGLVNYIFNIPQRITHVVSDAPPLEKQPYIQLVRYWVPINVKRIPAGTKLTTSTETTYGFELGFNYSLTIKTGISGSAGIFSFNQEMTRQFGMSFNYSYSVRVTETKEVASPENMNTAFIVWQLVEEFRVVDETGKMFTDPNYDFKSMLIATIPTELIVEQAHQFVAF